MGLDILETYMELAERQNDTIIALTELIRKQAEEICQLRGPEGYDLSKNVELALASDTINKFNNLSP